MGVGRTHDTCIGIRVSGFQTGFSQMPSSATSTTMLQHTCEAPPIDSKPLELMRSIKKPQKPKKASKANETLSSCGATPTGRCHQKSPSLCLVFIETFESDWDTVSLNSHRHFLKERVHVRLYEYSVCTLYSILANESQSAAYSFICI